MTTAPTTIARMVLVVTASVTLAACGSNNRAHPDTSSIQVPPATTAAKPAMSTNSSGRRLTDNQATALYHEITGPLNAAGRHLLPALEQAGSINSVAFARAIQPYLVAERAFQSELHAHTWPVSVQSLIDLTYTNAGSIVTDLAALESRSAGPDRHKIDALVRAQTMQYGFSQTIMKQLGAKGPTEQGR